MTVGFCCFRLPLDDFDNFRAADGEDDAEVVFFSIDLVLGGFLDVVVKEEEEEGDVRFSMASPSPFSPFSPFSLPSSFFSPSSPSSLLLFHFVGKVQVFVSHTFPLLV